MFCRGRAAGCEAALCWRGGGRAPNEAGADGCLDRQLFRSALCRVSPSCLGSELPAQMSPDTDVSDGNRRWLVEECGVDIESPDRSGVTPLQAACENGHVDVASYICSLPCTPAVALRRSRLLNFTVPAGLGEDGRGRSRQGRRSPKAKKAVGLSVEVDDDAAQSSDTSPLGWTPSSSDLRGAAPDARLSRRRGAVVLEEFLAQSVLGAKYTESNALVGVSRGRSPSDMGRASPVQPVTSPLSFATSAATTAFSPTASSPTVFSPKSWTGKGQNSPTSGSPKQRSKYVAGERMHSTMTHVIDVPAKAQAASPVFDASSPISDGGSPTGSPKGKRRGRQRQRGGAVLPSMMGSVDAMRAAALHERAVRA